MRFLISFLFFSVLCFGYVQPKTVMWDNSTDTDVVKHRVYIVEEGATIDPLSSAHVDVMMPDNFLILPHAAFVDLEGNYTVGVAAIDAAGNISTIPTITYFFDFLPPSQPLNIRVQ